MDGVVEAVGREEWAEALRLALVAWRERPSACVADAIEAIDAVAQVDVEAGDGRSKEAFQRVWLQRARDRGDAVGVGWLAAHLTRRVPVAAVRSGILSETFAQDKYEALLARLDALEPLSPDPRLAAALMGVIERAPYSVWDLDGAAVVYGALLSSLAAQRDARQIAPLRQLIAEPNARTDAVRKYLRGALPEVVAVLERYDNPPPPDAARWRTLAPRPVAGAPVAMEGALLEAIRADPDDDETRLVYADLLQARGDPQGELIVLQMMPPADADKEVASRVSTLVRDNKHAWLGEDLAAVLTHVQFERGFVSSAALAQSAAAAPERWKRAAADPRLATIHTLAKGRANARLYTSFVTSPMATGLRKVDVPSWALLAEVIRAGREPQVRHLVLHKPLRAVRLREIGTAAALSAVDALTVHVSSAAFATFMHELQSSPLVLRLRSLAIRPGYPAIAPADVFQRWPELPMLHELVYSRADDNVLALVRTADGVQLYADGEVASTIPGTIETLPPEVRKIRVRNVSPATRDAIVEATVGRGLDVELG